MADLRARQGSQQHQENPVVTEEGALLLAPKVQPFPSAPQCSEEAFI